MHLLSIAPVFLLFSYVNLGRYYPSSWANNTNHHLYISFYINRKIPLITLGLYNLVSGLPWCSSISPLEFSSTVPLQTYPRTLVIRGMTLKEIVLIFVLNLYQIRSLCNALLTRTLPIFLVCDELVAFAFELYPVRCWTT